MVAIAKKREIKKNFSVSSMSKKKVPRNLLAATVLYYIGAAFYVLLGLLIIIVGILILAGGIYSLASEADELVGLTPILGVLGPVLLVGGVIFIGLAVLLFFIARGVYRGQNWARIVGIILCSLGFLGSLISLIGGSLISIIYVLITGYILYVLIFDRETKVFFSR